VRVLIAEDDDDQATTLEAFIGRQGHECVRAVDGAAAFQCIKEGEYPLLITDWKMPGVSGPQLCGMVRGLARQKYTYIIMLTALKERSRLIEALSAGADDFIRKPIDFDELAARITVADRIQRLHDHVTVIEGLLSICAECKKIRNDAGQWEGIEHYIGQRTELSFSHGYCPVCLDKTRKEWGLGPAKPRR
jgi:DNA-binding response OmpR family regulator